MTSSARPNLGGLFTGSTPAERTSRITESLGPRLVVTPPVADDAAQERPTKATADRVRAEKPITATAPTARAGDATQPAPPSVADSLSSGPADDARGWPALEWIDPVKAVERYFAFLQSVLDVNRDIAVALTSGVVALPRRVGLRK